MDDEIEPFLKIKIYKRNERNYKNIIKVSYFIPI